MRYELHILSFFNVEVVLPFQQIFVHVHMMADKLKKSRPFGLPSGHSVIPCVTLRI